MVNKFIYFDHASTSPLSKNVLSSINYASSNYWGNVSSSHNFGIECSYQLEKIRKDIATRFSTISENIIFTSGSTESISLVFNKFSTIYNNGSLLISSVEHNATTLSANILKDRGWKVNKINVDNTGIIDIQQIHDFDSKDLKFISIIWGQSEIGSVQPIQQIGEIFLKEDIIFHVDGTQIISNGLFNWDELNCDLLSFSAHKFGGPKGIGVLLCNEKSRNIIKNNDISLSHEYSIRAGTQSIPLISGLNVALSNITSRIQITSENVLFGRTKAQDIRDYLLNIIIKNNKIQITGNIKNRLPNHLSFILFNSSGKPIKSSYVINFMSDNNIAVSSGSACSKFTNIANKPLKNMGFSEELIDSNIRVSFNSENTKEEVDKFYKLILECINQF